MKTCTAQNAEDLRRAALRYAERAYLHLDDVFTRGLEPDCRAIQRARASLVEARRHIKCLEDYVSKLDELADGRGDHDLTVRNHTADFAKAG